METGENGCRHNPMAVRQLVVNRPRHGRHEPVRFVAGQDAPELLRRPLGRRMLRDIPMQNSTRADLQHQEHVHEPERGRDRHEEIARQLLAKEEVFGCETAVRGAAQRHEVEQITKEKEYGTSAVNIGGVQVAWAPGLLALTLGRSPRADRRI